MIYITHNLDLMSELCDRAIVMNKGQIVERGDVVNLFNSPKHDYTKMLLDCVPRLDDSVARLSKYKKRPHNPLRKKSEFLESVALPLFFFAIVNNRIHYLLVETFLF